MRRSQKARKLDFHVWVNVWNTFAIPKNIMKYYKPYGSKCKTFTGIERSKRLLIEG